MTEDMFVGSRVQRSVPPPPISLGLAQQMRFSAPEFQQARAWYRARWDAHVNAGRPGAPGRLNAAEQATHLMPAAADAAELLVCGVADVLDPCLAAAADDLDEAERTIDELRHWAQREVTVEGRPWTLGHADDESHRLSAQIQHDIDAGKAHHQRTPRALHRLSNLLLLLDLLAISVVFVELLDIDVADPLASVPEELAAICLPVMLLAAQWRAARFAGRRWNVYLSRQAAAPGLIDAAGEAPRPAMAVAAAAVLPVIVLLPLGLYDIAAAADLGLPWRIVLGLLGLAIGLGAPLMKARVVAGDGSIDSRRRDDLEAALLAERGLADEAAAHARDCLDSARRRHEDYARRLRPRVLHTAGGPLVETENALGLLHLMMGEADAWQRAELAASAADLPPLRWATLDEPEIDNSALVTLDRLWSEQVSHGSALRTQLRELPHRSVPPARRITS
jgi:hypothetical protein